MSRAEYKPNELIIDRAVAIWKKILSNPMYKNTSPGDSDLSSAFAGMMVDMLPKNNTPDILDLFGVHLKNCLMNKGEYGYVNYLRVDYDPDQYLSGAAKEAGLKMNFPWKTSMFLKNDYVSISYGYGAPRMNHCPLENDKWLVTSLSGDDMKKVIEKANGGDNLGLLIEE